MFIIKFDEWRGWFTARVKINTRNAGRKTYQYRQPTLSVLPQSIVTDDKHQFIFTLLWLYNHLPQRHWLRDSYEHLWNYNGEITSSRVSYLLCTTWRTFWIIAIFLLYQKCFKKKLDSLYQLCCFHYWMSYLLCRSQIVHDSQSLPRNVCWTFQCNCSSTYQRNYTVWTLRSFWCLPAAIHNNWYLHSVFSILHSLVNLQWSNWI